MLGYNFIAYVGV